MKTMPTARGWFQCPDTGDEVCVRVYPPPMRARCEPTSRLADPEAADTESWCENFNATRTVGLADTVATLRSFGVGRSDVNWE